MLLSSEKIHNRIVHCIYNNGKANKANTEIGGGSDGNGGGGGSTQDSKENDALDNLAKIANYNAEALRWKQRQGFDTYDISDQMADKLWNQQTKDNKSQIGSDWFEQMKKFQSTANNLKGTAGDSLSGSNLYNFMDLLNRENDSIRSGSLNTQRENQNNINNDWYETISANINARNQLAADTEYGLKNILSDYAAQATSVAPEKAKERGIFADGEPGTINQPDWLNPDGYYDSIKRGAADTKNQGWYLEDDAQRKANELQQKNTANSSAANGDYWQNLLNGYNKRY